MRADMVTSRPSDASGSGECPCAVWYDGIEDDALSLPRKRRQRQRRNWVMKSKVATEEFMSLYPFLRAETANEPTLRHAEERLTIEIGERIDRLEEKFDTVAGFVLALGHLVQYGLEGRPLATDRVLEAFGSDSRKETRNWNREAPEFQPGGAQKVNELGSMHAGHKQEANCSEPSLNEVGVQPKEWEALDRSIVELDGEVDVAVLPVDVHPVVSLHHVAPWRDCDVKPLMTKYDGQSGSDGDLQKEENAKVDANEYDARRSSKMHSGEEAGERAIEKTDESRSVWRGRSQTSEQSCQHEPGNQRGHKVQVPFYDEGHKARCAFVADEPIGALLNSYCDKTKLSRNQVSFEIWGTEVADSLTWTQLQNKHGKDTFIDVERLV